jgi:hypothetical protein
MGLEWRFKDPTESLSHLTHFSPPSFHLIFEAFQPVLSSLNKGFAPRRKRLSALFLFYLRKTSR